MTRGRPSRRDPRIVSGPKFQREGKPAAWHRCGLTRFRLGVPLGEGGEGRSDDELSAERFEYSVRYHQHMRALKACIATPFDEDVAHSTAERLALKEMRNLQRSGGRWLTRTKVPAMRPGRKQKTPDLMERWSALKRKWPSLTVRSGARLLAKELAESAVAIEARLRRMLESSTKYARK